MRGGGGGDGVRGNGGRAGPPGVADTRGSLAEGLRESQVMTEAGRFVDAVRVPKTVGFGGMAMRAWATEGRAGTAGQAGICRMASLGDVNAAAQDVDAGRVDAEEEGSVLVDNKMGVDGGDATPLSEVSILRAQVLALRAEVAHAHALGNQKRRQAEALALMVATSRCGRCLNDLCVNAPHDAHP
jgi:hypothetical protein